jgi:ABC-2 type transport system permease protein
LVEVRGLVSLAGLVLMMASGFLVPLQFISGPLGSLCRATPFASMGQQPIEVFLELRPAWQAWLPQLVWLVVLEGVLQLMIGSATRKLVVQGG